MITPSVNSVVFNPIGPKTKALLGLTLITGIALMVIGALALSPGPHGCCLASIGMKQGMTLLFTGFALGMLSCAIYAYNRPIRIKKPDLSAPPIQPTIRNGRFVNGEHDYNPLWDTVENMELMYLGAFHHYSPSDEERHQIVDSSPPTSFNGELGIQWLGHDCFLIQTQGATLLTGPNWSDYIPFIGNIPLYNRAIKSVLKLDQLPKIDAVLESHTHRDHFDKPTLGELRELHNSMICCPTNAGKLLPGFTNVQEMSWWEEKVINGVKITYLPANHASQTSALDCNRYLWGGYLFEVPLSNGDTFKIYFMGDTACNINSEIKGFRPRYWANDTKLFNDISKLGPFDVVICGIDPIDGQEDKHANLSQLADLMLKLKPGMIIPSHWGTWPFDRWKNDLLGPLREFKAHFEQYPQLRDKIRPMKIGELLTLVNKPQPAAPVS